jgi:hypothetical protein
MANIIYADPAGSYIKGQQLGTQNAIEQGMAARQMRAMDLDPRVAAWYLPFVRQQMLNNILPGEFSNAARVAQYTGNPAPINEAVSSAYGLDPSTFAQRTPFQQMVSEGMVGNLFGPYSSTLGLPGTAGFGYGGSPIFGPGGAFVNPEVAAAQNEKAVEDRNANNPFYQLEVARANAERANLEGGGAAAPQHVSPEQLFSPPQPASHPTAPTGAPSNFTPQNNGGMIPNYLKAPTSGASGATQNHPFEGPEEGYPNA